MTINVYPLTPKGSEWLQEHINADLFGKYYFQFEYLDDWVKAMEAQGLNIEVLN